LEYVDFVVVGVPFDTAASNRTGQRYGPQHVRDFSVLLRPYNPDQDIDIFEYCSGVDYGDFDIVPGNVHKTYDNIVDGLKPILEKDITPIMIGGDHNRSEEHTSNSSHVSISYAVFCLKKKKKTKKNHHTKIQ